MMSEEEIMQGINKTLSFMKEELKAEHSCFNIKELDALNGLLDLYKQEKEKNKELFEKYEKRVNELERQIATELIGKDEIKEKLENMPHWLTEEEVRGINFFVNELLEGDKNENI